MFETRRIFTKTPCENTPNIVALVMNIGGEEV